jgi:hypothetical protein
VLTPRIKLSAAIILLALAGCRDAAAPRSQSDATRPLFSLGDTTISILRQAPTAPRLEAYQRSFWAYVSGPTSVTVNYLPAAGQSIGQPFLQFAIPKNGLWFAGGVQLKQGDSVNITLTIDTLTFDVRFEPSGVLFRNLLPANLTIWYQNANPDLNGDGMVNGQDKQLMKQLGFWYHGVTWSQVASSNDTTLQSVSAGLYHFSEYAMSW